MTPFHLAFRVDDLETTRRFYVGLLGCEQGREAANWIDFDFWGHQISAHIGPRPDSVLMTRVDGKEVPLSHFGAVLAWDAWEGVAARLARAQANFVIAPQVRFAGQPAEQGTFFVADPSGNVLEFKSFRNADAMFGEGASAQAAA